VAQPITTKPPTERTITACRNQRRMPRDGATYSPTIHGQDHPALPGVTSQRRVEAIRQRSFRHR